MTVGIFFLAHESHIILSASRCSVIPIEITPRMAEHGARQLQFAAMVSASAPRTPATSKQAASDNSGFGLRAGCVLILTAILFFALLGPRSLWSSAFRCA